MPTDSIPQISLGTAVLIIFLVCAGFVMLRGMTRLIVGSLVLALSAWIGFIVWQKAPQLSSEWFGKSDGLTTIALPVAAFLASWILLRKIAKAVIKPFGDDQKAEEKAPSLIGTGFRLLVALVMTATLCLIGAAFVHHAGSVAEVKSASKKTGRQPAPPKFSQQLKSSVDGVLPKSWLKALDPLAEPSRLALAKLIAAQADSPPEPVIDPRTKKPIPRAIIVDDPELQTLAREGKFGTLLRHPLLTKALNDPKIKTLIKDLKL